MLLVSWCYESTKVSLTGLLIMKLYEWTEKYHGSGHSGLFIETNELDDVVNRVNRSGAEANDIVIHEWGGRCCSVTEQTRLVIYLT